LLIYTYLKTEEHLKSVRNEIGNKK